MKSYQELKSIPQFKPIEEVDLSKISEETAAIYNEISKLTETIDSNSYSLALLCDGNGAVILNSALQPIYRAFIKKPKTSEIKSLMKAISDAADQIVDLNIKARNLELSIHEKH